MVAPRKYPDELRDRAIRLVLDAKADPASSKGACARIGGQLGINPETGWVAQAEVDAGTRPGTSTDQAARIAELEREVRELRRANAILKSELSHLLLHAGLSRRSNHSGRDSLILGVSLRDVEPVGVLIMCGVRVGAAVAQGTPRAD